MNIKGKKLTLRPLRKSDIPSLVKNANHKSVAKYTLVPHPYRAKDAEAFIELSREKSRKNISRNFAIISHETGEVAGMMGLNRINHQHRRVEIGYWIGVDYRGKGLTTEALNLVVKYSFNNLKALRAHAFVDPKNVASIRVLEKAGFKREGLLKKFYRSHNRQSDVYIYAKVK